MKVTLQTGKYYRRENGNFIEYKAGDVFNASSAEIRRLDVKEEIFIPSPVQRLKRSAPSKTPDISVDTEELSNGQ